MASGRSIAHGASTSKSLHFSAGTNLASVPGPSRPTPISRRSSQSAPSPFLAPALQPHEFPLPSQPIDKTLPFETKHSGPASLKRIFIGPHRLAGRAGKSSADERQQDDDEEGEDESSSGDSGDESTGDGGDGTAAQVRKGLRRSKRRAERLARRGKVKAPPTSAARGGRGGRAPSIHKWAGGSFEIGGDLREAAIRRRDASIRRAATMAASAVGTPSKLTGDARSFVTAKSSAVASLANGRTAGTTFITAKTEPNSTMLTPRQTATPASYEPADPPQAVEDALPALTHNLLRRPSDLPFSDSASLPPIPSYPPAPNPFPSILKRNGSALAPLANDTPAHSSGAKSVQALEASRAPLFTESPVPATPPGPHSGDRPPPSADEVLSRPERAVAFEDIATLAGPNKLSPRGKRDVLRQDRMLVRAEWTPRVDLPDDFDENSARRFPTQQDRWEENAVVWRPGRIEIYTDYWWSATSAFVGHKKLKHVIPLNPSRTSFSIYSSPDLIFCLAHRPNPNLITPTTAPTGASQPKGGRPSRGGKKRAQSAYANHHRNGTNVYIFRPRTSFHAKEWIWELFLALGGSPPSILDISVPGLGAKIRLPVPIDLQPSREPTPFPYFLAPEEVLTGQGYRSLKPAAVVKACVDQLSNVPEWRELLAQAEREGVDFKLVWRRGGVLDWIGVDGDEPDWAVVGGFAILQPGLESSLELRPAIHYPTTVHMPVTSTSPSIRLSEPPGIEGYVTRYRPNGNVDRVYISTHDGHLFLCRTSTAHPPEPPLPVLDSINNPAALVLAPFVLGFASMGHSNARKAKLRDRLMGESNSKRRRKLDDDARRAVAEEEAEGHMGMLERLERSEKKRCLDQIMAAKGYVDLRDITSVERASGKGDEEDDEVDDLGGEQGLAASADTELLRRQRSFILTARSGSAVRFECYSVAVATEWIGRLTSLITYWTRRELVDAIDQMELQPNSGAHRRASAKQSQRAEAADPNPSAYDTSTSPLLTNVYNWCVIDACRNIIRCGIFHLKRGARGVFRQRYVFLLPDRILEFQTKQRDAHGQPTKTIYHQRLGTINLVGCYAISGRLAPNVLSPRMTSDWEPADSQHHSQRVYTATDGLVTGDEEEDCTLVLFRKKAMRRRLGAKGKYLVFRARSKVERDAFLYALNVCIEILACSETEPDEGEFWLDGNGNA